jgi:hypothetical protein
MVFSLSDFLTKTLHETPRCPVSAICPDNRIHLHQMARIFDEKYKS